MQRYNFFIIFAACNHTKLKMKIFQSSIFRAICAIVVGALLIKYPDDSEGRIISGTQPTFPIVGAGSIILGLTLALTPGIFIHGLMYILGAIMILGGLNQLMALISARRLGNIPFAFWIAPSLILITGLFVVLKPMDSTEIPLLILGWCSLLYGVTETINSFKIRSIRKEADRQRDELARQRSEEEAKNAEEISSHIGNDSLDKGLEDVDSSSVLMTPRDN